MYVQKHGKRTSVEDLYIWKVEIKSMRNLQEFGSRQFNPLKNQQNFDMIQTVLELVSAIKIS